MSTSPDGPDDHARARTTQHEILFAVRSVASCACSTHGPGLVMPGQIRRPAIAATVVVLFLVGFLSSACAGGGCNSSGVADLFSVEFDATVQIRPTSEITTCVETTCSTSPGTRVTERNQGRSTLMVEPEYHEYFTSDSPSTVSVTVKTPGVGQSFAGRATVVPTPAAGNCGTQYSVRLIASGDRSLEQLSP